MPEVLGSFTEAEIAEIAQDVQIPEQAGASPTERFVRQISELVALRVAAGEAEGISIILRSDALASDVEGQTCERFPYLRNGHDPISQRVFVSNAVLGLAYAIQVDESAADQMAAVQQAGFGRLPALIIDWRGDAPKAALYGSGVDNPDDVQDVYLTETDITPEDLKAGLDDFYTKRLRTPSLVVQGNSVRVWGEEPAKGWPAERPEEKIQGVLMNFLYARYSRFDVRAEVVNEDGRLDLIIFAKLFDGSGAKIVKNVWVLELKALTDRTSTGGPVAAKAVEHAIEKGLTQAISYKEAGHVNQAAMCCFDMRSTDLGNEAVFDHVTKEANDNEVHLWRWYLYRSSEANRAARRKERLAANPAEA